MQRDSVRALATDPPLVLGEFVLDRGRGELLDRAGRPAALRAQALKVLLVLGEHAGQVVSKDELLRRVWGDVVVTEDSLVQAVGDIRRLLGSAGGALRTVPRRGYVLDAEAVPDRDSHATAIPTDPPPASPSSKRLSRRVAWSVAPIAVVAALLFAGKFLPVNTVSAQTLAILPFESANPPDESWLADAITSDLNAMVAQWRGGPQVMGHGTMQGYKGKSVDARTVGRELNVAHVLTGRVRRDGDRVRIDVELVDTGNGQVLWSLPYDIERGKLPDSIGDIAGGIAKALNIEIGDVVTRHVRALDAAQVNADDLAMRAWSVFLKRLGPDSFDQARQLFEQALARDPTSLRALAGVSLTNSMNVSFAYTTDVEGAMRRSKEALALLEAKYPTSHLTLVTRASFLLSSSDWAGQFAASEELIRYYPNEPTSYHHRCSSLLRLGRFDEAIPACDRAIRISPRESRTPVWNALAGMNEFMRGRYAAAADRARLATTANTKVPGYFLLLAAALVLDGRHEEARLVIVDFRKRHPEFDSARMLASWSSKNADPSFVDGMNRMANAVRELGLP